MLPGTRKEHHKDARTSREVWDRTLSDRLRMCKPCAKVGLSFHSVNVIVSILAPEMNSFGKSSARCVR